MTNNIHLVPQTSVENKIFIPISGDDFIADYSDFGLTFESSEAEILTAIRSVVQERFNVDIGSAQSGLYKTRKATESRNIYVIPNSIAGQNLLLFQT